MWRTWSSCSWPCWRSLSTCRTMAQPDQPQPAEPANRRRQRRSRFQRVAAHLWSEWRIEVLIVLLIAIGTFLLVERMQIRETIVSGLRSGFRALEALGSGTLQGIGAILQNTTLSDLIGYVLLLGALIFVVWRVRWRLVRSPRFTVHKCPRCGNDLGRIHRRITDRVLSLYLPVARYRCKNRDCWWQGLRIKPGQPE
jgi:predicted RNA-binding Zn-ribbon protein involved in translation (DUF1610 family)